MRNFKVFLLVIVLSNILLFGFMNIGMILTTSINSGYKIVEIAGKQRELSQRATKDIVLLQNKEINEEKKSELKDDFHRSISLLAKINKALLGEDKSYKKRNSPLYQVDKIESYEIREKLLDQKRILDDYIVLANKVLVGEASVNSLIDVNDSLSVKCHEITLLTIDFYKGNSNKIIIMEILVSLLLIVLAIVLILNIYSSYSKIKSEVSTRQLAQKELEELNETLEKKVEEQTEELLSSNAELENFASIASHDLQEPLRKVSFFMGRLNKEYYDKLDDDGKKYISIALSATKRMGQLINDLLDLSRVHSKGAPFEDCNLKEVIEHSISDLEIKINESKARVHVDDLPIANVDSSQIRQLFANLISNGIKYQKENSEPEIYIKHKQLENEFIEIAVSDNGIGMDNEHLSQIFLPFRRLHSRSEYEGTGIGLAICEKIVKRHSGKLSVDSRKGEGSTFKVILPTNRRST